MENNEDKRQMTVISEAMNRIDTRIDEVQDWIDECETTYYQDGIDSGHDKMHELYFCKKILESLLPKERNIMEDCFSIGQVKGFRASQGDKPIEPSEYFNETFKPYEK